MSVDLQVQLQSAQVSKNGVKRHIGDRYDCGQINVQAAFVQGKCHQYQRRPPIGRSP
jgi:hypothetical protein